MMLVMINEYDDHRCRLVVIIITITSNITTTKSKKMRITGNTSWFYLILTLQIPWKSCEHLA